MRVFVKNKRGQALMPCSKRKARLLLKANKAKIIVYKPFTIQLLFATGETIQNVNLGIKTGAKYIGIAVESDGKILSKGVIELRDDIHKNMTNRALLRRNRRNRKTRYRKARFLNRKRKEKWLPPTIQSKINAVNMWVDKFTNLLPNPLLHIEVGKFDTSKLNSSKRLILNKNDHNNIRYYVFARDDYTCQVCKKKNKILQIHHIVYKSCGGTNNLNNLISVCTDCHTYENHQKGNILYEWMVKKKKVRQYKDFNVINIVRKRLIAKYKNAVFYYGYENAIYLKTLNLNKTPYNDAIATIHVSNIKSNSIDYFYIKQFRKKKRSLHETYPRKFRKNKNVLCTRVNKNVPSRNGIYMNDMVKCENQIGWVYGFSSGDNGKECIIRDIDEKLIKLSTRNKNTTSVPFRSIIVLNHNNNWQYTILTE